MARLDDMVARYLTGLIETGAYDDAGADAARSRFDYAQPMPTSRRRAAEAGIVLLKNDHALLPLARTAHRIVLIGGHADVGVLSGGGSSQVRSVGGAPVEIPLTSGAAIVVRARDLSCFVATLKAMQRGASAVHRSPIVDGARSGGGGASAARGGRLRDRVRDAVDDRGGGRARPEAARRPGRADRRRRRRATKDDRR